MLSPSFFFKIFCLLVCLVDSCSFDLKHCILDFVLVCFLLSVLLPDFHYIVETL